MASRNSDHASDTDGTRLFDGVNAYISRSLPEAQAKQLAKILSREKARFVDFSDPSLTHFVTDTLPPSDALDYVAPRSGLHYATPYWIERTIILGTRQEPDFYSPHPAMLFSGVVATASDLSRSDNEVMAAGISSLGGQWRYALTRDVTHLFTLGKGSLKYKTAMHYKDEKENEVPIPIKIVVPHWFDDVVRLGVRNLPTDPYEWPEPRVFSGHAANVLKTVGAASATTGAEDDRENRRARPLSAQKRALYDTIFQDTIDLPKHLPASNDTWVGLKLMFGSNLGFTVRQREAHVADVMRAGGEVIEYESPQDELNKIEQADIYIAQHRSGRAFVKAYKLNKTIGNLHWFWYVRCTGILSRPTDQLLHYPIPKDAIEGFSKHLITVTNFTGKDREYIKKLLLMLGVPYTATMTGKNTAVIAAYVGGEKTDKASSWGIPIVNHMWLEDCFAQWRDIPTAQEKYTAFPPGLDYGDVLADDGGRAGLGLAGGTGASGRVGYDQAELDKMETEIHAEAAVLAQSGELEEKENKTRSSNEVTETPKRGILKKSKGMTEDAAATARRLALKRAKDNEGEDAEMDEVVEASSSVYVDMHVALDDDGKLSVSGSELGLEPDQPDDDDEEDRMDVDEAPKKQRTKSKNQDKARPTTPVRGRPRASASSSKLPSTPARRKSPATPKTKATPPAQSRVSSKPKTKAAPIPSPPEDEDEEEEHSSPVRPRRTPAAAAKTIKKTIPDADESEEDEQSIEEAPRVGRPTSRRAAMKGKDQAKGDSRTDRNDSDAFAGGSSARKGTVIKTYRSRSRSRSRGRTRQADEDEDAVVKPKPKGKPKPVSKGKSRQVSDDDSDVEVVQAGPSKKAPATPKVSSSRKRRKGASSDTEEEEAEKPPKTKAKSLVRQASQASTVDQDADGNELTSSPARPRTPRRRASVLLPTLAEVLSASQSQLEPDLPTSTGKKVSRKESIDVQAKDAPAKSPPKRGRPSVTKSMKRAAPKAVSPSPERSLSPAPARPPPSKPKAVRRVIAAPAAAREAGPSSRVQGASSGHTRRSAATKAAQKLHDEVMPDLVNFQRELKSGQVKSGYEEQAAAAGKGREKEKEPAPKGQKRASLEGADGDESEDEHDVKKRRTETGIVATKGRSRKSDVPPLDEDEEEGVLDEPKKRGRLAGKSKAATQPSETQAERKDVIIMTTQVNLSDDQTKALTKMGVRFTTKPGECTHLVARGIVRTEKFLCAMAVAPYIVTDKWVEASVSKKKILPEKDYALKDLDNEKRYGYKLADALARAKTNGRKLFEGKTFYVTPKVPADGKLLKAVVTAGGGQVLTQNPTLRILKGHDNRFVISSPTEVSIWRPLAESGYPIYSQELILTAVLKQKVEWDKEAYKVPGSY